MNTVYSVIEGMELYINNSCITAKPYSKFEYDVFKHGHKYASERMKNNEPGYLIQFSNGTITWQNEILFKETHVQNTALSFGLAIVAMELRMKLTRSDWNDEFVQKFESTPLNPFIQLYRNNINEGIWFPSQQDMFAKDWEVIPNN